jgi:hypothetical protein
MELIAYNLFLIIFLIICVCGFILNYVVLFINKFNEFEKKTAKQHNITDNNYFKKSFEQKNIITNYWMFIGVLLCLIVSMSIINKDTILKYFTIFKYEIILYVLLTLIFAVSYYFYNMYYVINIISMGEFEYTLDIN